MSYCGRTQWRRGPLGEIVALGQLGSEDTGGCGGKHLDLTYSGAPPTFPSMQLGRRQFDQRFGCVMLEATNVTLSH